VNLIDRLPLRIQMAWWTWRLRWSSWRIERIAKKLNQTGTTCLPTDARELVDRAAKLR
jgi:hypothetical protein